MALAGETCKYRIVSNEHNRRLGDVGRIFCERVGVDEGNSSNTIVQQYKYDSLAKRKGREKQTMRGFECQPGAHWCGRLRQLVYRTYAWVHICSLLPWCSLRLDSRPPPHSNTRFEHRHTKCAHVHTTLGRTSSHWPGEPPSAVAAKQSAWLLQLCPLPFRNDWGQHCVALACKASLANPGNKCKPVIFFRDIIYAHNALS